MPCPLPRTSIKYCLVSCIRCLQRGAKAAIMNLKDARVQLTMVYISYLSNIILLVALGLGLYTQWMYTENVVIIGIALCGLLVFGISCALQYYFDYQTFGKALLHIWLGCILGIIIFANQEEYQFVTTQEVMDILLLTSALVGAFWSICERCMHLTKFEPQIFSITESLESLGLIIASVVTGLDALPISFIVVAFVLNLVALRFKSLLGLFSTIAFLVTVQYVFFPVLSLKVNIYGLTCFVFRHIFEPFIDLYFSGLSTLERWQAFFNQSKLIRHLFVLVIFILNLVTAVEVGILSANHKEWFVVVPLFIAFAIVWLCFHVIYFISSWKLMSKITDCNQTLSSISDDRKSMNRIMASKGIRHFSLISQRLMCLTLLTTCMLFGIGWETKNGYSIGMILMIVPIECMTLSLFLELANNLGGTCIGYALIAPHTGQRSGSGAKLLPAVTVQEIISRATATLNKVQEFLNFNMIENYGCDFFSSGLGHDLLQPKIKNFFERKTADGPRYDTYLLYYTGDVYDSGDWALSDNQNLKLDTILEWWAAKNADSGSRLILVVDSQHSWNWAKAVSQIQDAYVALQTCKFTRPPDPEFGEKKTVGAFTDDWVLYNQGGDVEPSWSDKERTVRAVYKVSKIWTDFCLHLPTKEDIEDHWDINFPKFTKPLIKGVNMIGNRSVCCCCDSVTRCCKRYRMKWLPPKTADTGHGFKLVRS